MIHLNPFNEIRFFLDQIGKWLKETSVNLWVLHLQLMMSTWFVIDLAADGWIHCRKEILIFLVYINHKFLFLPLFVFSVSSSVWFWNSLDPIEIALNQTVKEVWTVPKHFHDKRRSLRGVRLNLISGSGYQIPTYLCHLVLPHASWAVAWASAIGADPVLFVLSVLDRHLIEVLEAIAAKLLLAGMLYWLLKLNPLFLISHLLPLNEMINERGLSWLDVE